ncbi:MAG: hypothetical protein KDB63_20935, partial [Nocardioidaceae bacterium]|nr:hypothetical protein [Nocardioidaceae bacterium]
MFTTHDGRTRHRALVRLSAGLLLTGVAATVCGAPAQGAAPTCGGLTEAQAAAAGYTTHYFPGNTADVVVGSAANDWVYTDGGADSITTFGGQDIICAGGDGDFVDAGDNRDVV